MLEDGSKAVPGSIVAGRVLLGDTVVAIEKALCVGPGRFDYAKEAVLHFGGGGVAAADHVVDLGEAVPADAPGAGDDAEAFCREIDGSLVRAFIVPVADDDVFGDHIDGAKGIVIGGFPFADAGGLAVDKPVSPDPEFPVLLCEVVMERLYFAGEEDGGVAAAAAGAFGLADIEDLDRKSVV